MAATALLCTAGLSPFEDLNTSRESLNAIRCRIGNQCSCSKIGVMWFLRGQPDTNRGAEFLTRCNLSKRYDGKPQYKALLLSSREMTSAWMMVFGKSLVSLFFYEANASQIQDTCIITERPVL